MEHYLRGWREDAARKGQYDTAIFIGDKVLALTCTYGVHYHLAGSTYG